MKNILNRDYHYHIENSNTISNRPGIPDTLVQYASDHPNRQFYYYQFFGPSSLEYPLDKFIEKEILEQIRRPNSNVTLIANNAFESFSDVVDPLYDNLIVKQNIPAHKLIYGTDALNISTLVEEVARKYRKPKVQLVTFLSLEHMMKERVLYGGAKLPLTLQKTEYNKKFINLNRRWRMHRPTLVALMYIRDLLKYGYVSLARSDGDEKSNWKRVWRTLYHYHRSSPQITQELKENQVEISKLPELKVDVDSMDGQDLAVPINSTLPFYEDTYFSVVTETHFEYKNENSREFIQITDKTFKPILYKHPFVLLSVPHTLKALKGLGYQTFDSIIDESYDSIEDDQERMYHIINEINRLCNLNNDELKSFLDSAREICNYNFDMLMNKTTYYYKQNY